MRDVLEVFLSWTASTALSFVWLGYDERRLRGVRALRVWPDTTRALAVFALGALALPIHFWRTRRTILGTLAGVGAGAVVTAIDEGVTRAVDALPDLRLGPEAATTTAIAFTIELALLYGSYRVVRLAARRGADQGT